MKCGVFLHGAPRSRLDRLGDKQKKLPPGLELIIVLEINEHGVAAYLHTVVFRKGSVFIIEIDVSVHAVGIESHVEADLNGPSPVIQGEIEAMLVEQIYQVRRQIEGRTW